MDYMCSGLATVISNMGCFSCTGTYRIYSNSIYIAAATINFSLAGHNMLTDLRCWGRTRVVILANFHYNSIMTLSVYISTKHTIIEPPRQDINS